MSDYLVCPLNPNCTVRVKRGKDAVLRVRTVGAPPGRRPIPPSADLDNDLHIFAKYVLHSMKHNERDGWYWRMGQDAPEKRRLLVSIARAILQEPTEVHSSDD